MLTLRQKVTYKKQANILQNKSFPDHTSLLLTVRVALTWLYVKF